MERDLKEPAERERVRRSVRWCSKEQDLEEPVGHERVARSE